MSLDKLKTKRGTIKGQLSRFVDYLQTSSDKNEIEVRLKRVEELFDRFDETQSQIEEKDEAEVEKREQFENMYYSALAKAKGLITQTNNIVSEVKLSPLQVPTFTGNYEDWLHFRDTFKSLVDCNANLSDLQKYHYLLSSLKGQALQLVSSLEISANNYNTAWEILNGRYHNKRIIADKHVRSLFNISLIKNEDSIALRKLIDETQLHLRALETMNLPTSTWDALLVHLITGKLDPTTRHHWESYTIKDELPTYKELINCLSERARVIESTGISRTGNQHQRTRVNLHTGITSQSCPQCNGDHKLFSCAQFTAQTIEQRQETIKRLKLCFNCLRTNHSVKTCTSKSACKVCNKKHNTLLHRAVNQPTARENAIQTYSSQGGDEVLLSTVILELSQGETKHQVRALLDCGAQSNFITQSLCNRLKLKQQNLCIPVSGIHRRVTTVTSGANVKIRSLFSNYERDINCLVLPEITDHIPQDNVDRRSIMIPKGLQLADPTFDKRAPVDMLLGAQVFWEIINTDNIATSNSLLHNTLFGWVVAGQLPSSRKNPNLYDSHSKSSLCHVSLNQLHKDLERFWLIEELPTKISVKSKEDIACEEHFATTHRRDETGRFVVRLPFKNDQPELGKSLEIATKRQLALERRFRSDPLLHQEYCKFMKEYLTLGHMTPCPVTTTTPVNYLPHHAVHKSNKIRVVFDGSQKTTNGKSINDVLMTGPQLQRDLFTLLLNFRKHIYVMTADIEKMYRQFKVHEDDKNFQRIVWRFSEDTPLQHFQLNTVTYGLAPSSFIATRCLKQLSIDFADSYPLASQVISDDFYMDDLLTGYDDKGTILQLKADISTILQSAGQNLTKWKTNIPNVSDEFIEDVPFVSEDNYQAKILGLHWNSKEDFFFYKAISTHEEREVISKRHVLSEISKTFDPLGLLGPIILRSRLILQDLWQQQVSWDEPLSSDIKQRWENYKENLVAINKFQIPRRIVCDGSIQNELCGFCDASERAYGAVIYLRSKNQAGNHQSYLICAKSRVAPLKQLSLPRLELCGAVLLTRLIVKVKEALHMEDVKTTLWTDSTIVLHWLAGQPTRWSTFVANRTSEIQTDGKNCIWKHVVSRDNPADIVSRGATAIELMNSTLWWHGPTWLKEDEDTWPNSSPQILGEVPERKPQITLISTRLEEWNIFNKYSSFSKLRRVAAYMLRFTHNARKRQPLLSGELTVSELNKAEDMLVTHAQGQCFHLELNALKNNKYVSKQSNIKDLHPFIKNNILHVGGRLARSDITSSQKHQVLLPAHHKLTELIVRHYHYTHLHLGVQALLSIIRLKYWPILGKNLVKKVFKTCILCFRYKPRPCNQIMADLPRDRVVALKPFSICGTDFMGPVFVKSGMNKNSKSIKSYICLLICFATKAIHLELVLSLSTEAFLNAFKRFVARRGRPQKVYSDNATNFVGARNELQNIYTFFKASQNYIHNCLAHQAIEWKFIPARSPHFGGLWESSIKLVKTQLKKVLNSHMLDVDGMHTILCQIEACINSRPITPLSSDPNDLNPLSPSHFLVGENLSSLPERNVLEYPVSRLNHYERLNKLFQSFWERWHSDYLNELQRRSKWQKGTGGQLQQGDLVLIKEDNLPPMCWKLGRVVSTHPGADGVTRVVTLRTAQGEIKRAAAKLCRLPTEH